MLAFLIYFHKLEDLAAGVWGLAAAALVLCNHGIFFVQFALDCSGFFPKEFKGGLFQFD